MQPRRHPRRPSDPAPLPSPSADPHDATTRPARPSVRFGRLAAGAGTSRVWRLAAVLVLTAVGWRPLGAFCRFIVEESQEAAVVIGLAPAANPWAVARPSSPATRTLPARIGTAPAARPANVAAPSFAPAASDAWSFQSSREEGANPYPRGGGGMTAPAVTAASGGFSPANRPAPAHLTALRSSGPAGPGTFGDAGVRLNAVTFGWNGGGTNDFFSTGANWSNGTAPANDGTADLHFAGTTRLTPFAQTSYSLNSLSFDPGAGSFTISGATLTLGAGGINQNSANPQTINNPLTLGAAQTWTLANGAGALTINGAVNNGGNTLTVNAAANTTATLRGGLSGAGGVTLSGAGGVTLSGAGGVTLSGVNTYTGATTVSAGSLTFAPGSTLTGGGDINVGAGGALNVQGSVSLASGHPFRVDGSAGSPAAATLRSGGSLSTNNVSIGVTSAGTFTQSGGTFTTNGNVLYVGNNPGAEEPQSSGTYTLSGGSLSTLGAFVGRGGTGTFTQSGGSFTTNGYSLLLGYIGSGTYNLNGGIMAVGQVQSNGSGNTFHFNGGTLQAGANSTSFFQALNTADVLAGGAIIDTAGHAITIAQTLTSGTANGTADGGLTKLGAGTLTLTGASTYTGATTVGGGTLTLGSGGSLGGSTGTALAFTNTGAFNLNTGGTQNMGALSFQAGDGTVQSTYSGSGNAGLTFSSLTARTAGATGNFVVAGGTNGSTNRIVLTGQAKGFIDQGTFFNGGDYAFVSSAGGYVRAINYGNDGGSSSSGNNGSVDNALYQQITGSITGEKDNRTFTTLKIAGDYNFTLQSGATVTVSGLLKTNSNGGSSTISGGTALQAAQGAEMVIRTDTANDTLTISTPITNNTAGGTNALTKSGLGTLTLSGANTYTGPTTVNAGSLNLPAGGSLNGTGSITVSAGGAFNVLGGTVNPASDNVLFVEGTTGSPALVSLAGGSLSAAIEYIGGAGAGSFTQTGGTHTVSGVNFFLGYDAGGNGTYALSGDSTVSLSAVSEYIGYYGAGSFTQTGGTHTVSGYLYLGTYTGSSGTYTLGGGTLIASSVQGSLGTSIFNFDGGTLRANASGVNFLQGLTSANVLAGGARIDSGGFNVTVAQSLIPGASADGGLTKLGGGTLTLTGASTYMGATTVSAGTLTLDSGGSLGATSITVGAGASFQVTGTGALPATNAGGMASSSNLTLDGTTASPATATLAGTGALYRGSVLVGVNGAGTLTQSSGTLNVNPVGSVVLAQQAASSGTYNLNGGTLSAGVVAGGAGTSTFHFNGGTLQANRNNGLFLYNLTTADVQAGGAVIDTQSYNVTVAQTLVHDTMPNVPPTDGGLTKLGSGVLTLTAANTYLGNTAVSAGTLVANNTSGTATGIGSVTVANGATLGGRGTLAGALTVQSGGTLDPGLSIAPARLTLASGLALNSGATLTIELGGTTPGSGYSQVRLTAGALALAGSNLSVVELPGFSLAMGQTFVILDNTGTSLSLTGAFANTTAGSLYTDAAGNMFLVNYLAIADGDLLPNDVTLTVVPEPSTWACLLTGVCALGFVVRRRMKS